MELTAKEISKRGGKKRWANLKEKLSKKELSEMMRKVSKSRLTNKKSIVESGNKGLEI